MVADPGALVRPELIARLRAAGERLPDPVPLAIRHLVEVADEQALVFECFDVLAMVLRTLAALGLAQARACGLDGVAAIGDKLARPTLGALAWANRTLGTALSARSGPVPGLTELLAGEGPARARWDAIAGLIADRNRLVHAPAGGEIDVAPIVECLAEVVESLAFLRDLQVTASTAPPSVVRALEVTESPSRIVQELPSAWLHGPPLRAPLALDPWVIALPDGDATRAYVVHTLDTRRVWVDGAGRKLLDTQPSSAAAPEVDTSAAVVSNAESPPVESLDESLARAAEPLQRFVNLLERFLDVDTRAHLAARFDAMGYVGDDQARLVEYCLEHDLRDVLDELFSEPGAHKVARSLGLRTDPLEPRRTVVLQILAALDVPVPATPTGISARRNTVTRAAARLNGAADRAAVRGLIGEACTELERVLSDLVRFYGCVLLGNDLTVALRARGWLQPHQTLGRASLGTLLDLLGRLEQACLRAGTPEALRFAELFPGRDSLLGPIASERGLVARIRNSFSHVSEELDALDLVQLRRLAGDLFAALMPFFEFLERSGTYPRVVAVRETVRDAFGRQFVRAVDESLHEEKIYTDQPMEPGAAYFMHPLTNPVRIYPILIRTGD